MSLHYPSLRCRLELLLTNALQVILICLAWRLQID
jgi:hypothetical protein